MNYRFIAEKTERGRRRLEENKEVFFDVVSLYKVMLLMILRIHFEYAAREHMNEKCVYNFFIIIIFPK